MKKILSLGFLSTSLITHTVFGMDASKYAHATHLVVSLQENRVTFNNEPEWFQKKTFEEKKQLLLSVFQGINYEGHDGDQRLTIDCAQIPLLQSLQPAQTPSGIKRLLTQGLPLAAAFGIGYLVATKLNSTE